MKRLKSVFNGFYFTYLIISILLFVFRDSLFQQMDPDLVFRFVNFWLILGFVFFITIWIVQAVQIRFLKKDTKELEAQVQELKSKLYDVSRNPQPADTKNTDPLDTSQ